MQPMRESHGAPYHGAETLYKCDHNPDFYGNLGGGCANEWKINFFFSFPSREKHIYV
tara:strand:- start:592 stop:762 length:171 start_codon:yes stop_codon:yes gene_type:complete